MYVKMVPLVKGEYWLPLGPPTPESMDGDSMPGGEIDMIGT